MAEIETPFILGWEEWVALPELGLPAIKAKVDTGARTSALHAFLIEPFGTPSTPMVRFGVHPVPGRDDIAIFCSAPVVDSREVTSSNGEKETRFIIRSAVEVGGLSWQIEIGLTNRENMAYRMLLGRQAIGEDMMVDPTASFRQPRLSYKLYRHLPRHDPVRRTLRIAVLTATPDRPSERRLVAAAQTRGHAVELLDPGRLALTFRDGTAGLTLDGNVLAHYDAVIPRVGISDGAFGAAVVRQLELMGSYAVNSGGALDRSANRLASVQALIRSGVAQGLVERVAKGEPINADSASDIERPADAARTSASSVFRFLVVGGRVTAVIQRRRGKDVDVGSRRLKVERGLAEAAAAALGLGLAAVGVDSGGERPRVMSLSARPAIARFEQVTGAHVTGDLMALIESRARSGMSRME